MKRLWLLAGALIVLGLAANARAAQVMVFAAASLSDSLKQIAANYGKASGDTIAFNFAASGVLARQIEAGAPADIFLSADEAQMDGVAARGLIVTDSRCDLLGNSLVVVTPPGSTAVHTIADLTNAAVQHVAIGEWKTVPAGTYAHEYLVKSGYWPAIEPKVVACENVRAVLAAVEAGNADAGFVYRTDAAIAKKAAVAFEIPAAEGPKIVYPVAQVKGSGQAETAGEFLKYLESDTAAKVFRNRGFTVLASH